MGQVLALAHQRMSATPTKPRHVPVGAFFAHGDVSDEAINRRGLAAFAIFGQAWVMSLVDNRAQLLCSDPGGFERPHRGLANSDEPLVAFNAKEENE